MALLDYHQFIIGEREQPGAPLPPILNKLILLARLKDYGFNITYGELGKLPGKDILAIYAFMRHVKPEELNVQHLWAKSVAMSMTQEAQAFGKVENSSEVQALELRRRMRKKPPTP